MPVRVLFFSLVFSSPRRGTWELNVTEPVAGNFYPVTTAAAAVAADGRAALAVLVDRAQAGASLADGQLELMLHRRILGEDGRGVGEPLNETQCGCRDCACGGLVVAGTHRWALSAPAAAAGVARPLQFRVGAPLQPFFFATPPQPAAAANDASAGAAVLSVPPFSAVAGALPPNVHLLTYAPAASAAAASAVLAADAEAGATAPGPRAYLLVRLVRFPLAVALA